MITISFASRRALVALGAFVLSAQFGFAQSFPSVNSTGTGQNSVPVTAYAPPSNIPASEMPTPAGPSAGIEAAVQSYSVSQATPTSPQPTCQEPPATADYYLNEYTWPTVAQSIAWWESQPGIPAAGTYSYLIGTEYSHQDQEGWAGGCVADPEPYCPVAPGYIGYTWGGQTVGWTGSCTYTPPPNCSGTGYVGNYEWTGAAWTGSCNYIPPPACPLGYYDTYAWTGASWSGNCTQPPQPACPVGYSGEYEWSASSGVWVDDCTIPPQPSCPTGYDGSYSWNGSAWIDGCAIPPQPSCPVGYSGSYQWNGSAWIDDCTPAVSTCWVANTDTGYDSYGDAYAASCSLISELAAGQAVLYDDFVETTIDGYTFLDLAGSGEQIEQTGGTKGTGLLGYTVSISVPGSTSTFPITGVENTGYGGVQTIGSLDYNGTGVVTQVTFAKPGVEGTGKDASQCTATVLINTTEAINETPSCKLSD